MLKVSAIVPNYNHAPYLKDRIESILNQTYQDFELIILDDCSTDESMEVIDQYKAHPKVSAIERREVNSGSPFGLWKRGFELAKGELIWLAESDDWAEPEFLEKLVASFTSPAITLAHCKSFVARTINGLEPKIEINDFWKSYQSDLWEQDFVQPGSELFEQFGMYRCPVINVSSCLFKKSILDGVEIPYQYSYSGDWWFWSQLLPKGQVFFCARFLNYMRIHSSSATSRQVSNVPLKFVENVRVAQRVSALAGRPLTYHPLYEWILEYWTKEFLRTRNKVSVFLKPFIILPFSFKQRLVIRLYRHYAKRYFKAAL